MKIEMGESLGYSYLRHVQQCWLVQTNWKASEHWDKSLSDDELETVFRSMRQTFDLGGSVFKGTKNCAQFLRQAEIDVVGVGQDGSIHAIDVAFHEAGLNYGGGVGNRVLKKLLRTALILMAYHPAEVKRHIYFVSPKVHPAAQKLLEDMFDRLRTEYPSVIWHLFTNKGFAEQLLRLTLEKAGTVADTSELFVRSAKMLEVSGLTDDTVRPAKVGKENQEATNNIPDAQLKLTTADAGRIQPLMQGLMRTLLDDIPSLLDEADLIGMVDNEYCKVQLGLRIGNYAMLRKVEEGRNVGGYNRYWQDIYGGRYYVCSQWGKQYHLDNASSLLRFVEELMQRKAGHSGVAALENHRAKLRAFIG